MCEAAASDTIYRLDMLFFFFSNKMLQASPRDFCTLAKIFLTKFSLIALVALSNPFNFLPIFIFHVGGLRTLHWNHH